MIESLGQAIIIGDIDEDLDPKGKVKYVVVTPLTFLILSLGPCEIITSPPLKLPDKARVSSQASNMVVIPARERIKASSISRIRCEASSHLRPAGKRTSIRLGLLCLPRTLPPCA